MIEKLVSEYQKIEPGFNAQFVDGSKASDATVSISDQSGGNAYTVARFFLLPIANAEAQILRDKKVQKGMNQKLAHEIFVERSIDEQLDNPAKKSLPSTVYALSGKYSASTALLAKSLNVEATGRLIDENTACVFFEIITNPQMEIVDIQNLADVAHSKNTILVADTTTIPFTQFSSHGMGVDIEVVSSTKYISGGATSLGGLVIDYGTASGFSERIKGELLFNFGAYMTPQAAYLQTVGLETLDARYRVQSGNALELAKRLELLPRIKRVSYVGLPSNPYHKLARRQFGSTAGAMICIDLESEEACFDFIDSLKLIRRATNLFDNRTLAIHPYSTIFVAFTPEQKAVMDVLNTTVRLSIGLEHVDDLYNDILQALK